MQRETVCLVLDVPLTFSFLPRCKGKLILLDDHRNHHTELHHRQGFASAVVSAIREWNEGIFAKNKLGFRGPALRYEVVWSDECTGV